MNWNYLFTAISGICTLISIFGAYKSISYYKKSKHITILTNTNNVQIESQKIINTLSGIIKYANNALNHRGVNLTNEICINGESIKSSLNKIKEIIPVHYSNEIKNVINTQVEAYIDSLIDGTVFINNKFVIDNNFKNCQNAFYEVQSLIKKKLENISDKLK